jgi:uncharacterized membrane protein
MSSIHRSWLYIVPIILLSAGLTAGFLGFDALWYDETDTFYITGTGNFDPIAVDKVIFYTAIDNFPPLYFLLHLAWTSLTGGGLFISRCLPYFIGLVSIASMYQVGKHLFNARVGVFSSLLLGTSAFFLYYFHEIRPYTLFVLTSILHLWAYTLILKPEYYDRRHLRWLYCFALIAAIYTHYVGLVSVGVIGLYHLLLQRDNKNWAAILRLSINAGLTYTPWIAVVLVSLYNNSKVDWSAAHGPALIGSFVAIANGIVIPALSVLFASLLLWRKHRAVPMLWFWITVLIGLVTLGNLYARFIFHPRHYIVLFTPALLLVAYLIQNIEKSYRFLAFGIGLLWIGAGIFNTADLEFMYRMPVHYRTVPLVTMESAIEVTETCVQANDAVILELWHEDENVGIIHNSSYYYYFREAPFRYAQLSRMELIDAYFVDDLTETIDYPTRVDMVVQDAENVWLMAAPGYGWAYELEAFESILAERGYTSCGVFADRSDFMGKVYSLSAESCQQLVQSCSP